MNEQPSPTRWVYNGQAWTVTIAPSARKHGRTDADIWAVLNAPVAAVDDGSDPDGRTRVMLIGLATTGAVIEALVIFDEAAQAVVVHAHKPTAHTLKRLSQARR